MNDSAGVEEKEVCLVDDDLSALASMQFLLRTDGVKVKAFSKPEEFLQYVASHPVSLAVLDVWMDRVSGLEVLARLCAVSPRTRVIVIAAHEDPAARTTAMAMGPLAYFLKPLDHKKFLAAVHHALGE